MSTRAGWLPVTTATRPGARGNPPGRHGRDRFALYDAMPLDLKLALLTLSGDRLGTTLLWAAQDGWSPSALALALGVHRQQVSRLIAIARYHPSATTVAIPEPGE